MKRPNANSHPISRFSLLHHQMCVCMCVQRKARHTGTIIAAMEATHQIYTKWVWLISKLVNRYYTTGDESTTRYAELMKLFEPGLILQKFEGRGKNQGSRYSISTWCCKTGPEVFQWIYAQWLWKAGLCVFSDNKGR